MFRQLLCHHQFTDGTDDGMGVAKTCLYSNLKVLFSSLRLLQNCCFYAVLKFVFNFQFIIDYYYNIIIIIIIIVIIIIINIIIIITIKNWRKMGTLTPLVFGTNGGMGLDCQNFWRTLANKLSSKNNEA